MNTRRLRLVRPKWTLGAMLLIVGWSAVVVWLNVRPRCYNQYLYVNGREEYVCWVEYGCPWAYTSTHHIHDPRDEKPPSRLHATYIDSYWRLGGVVAIGLLAVAVLTFASRYLVRAIIAGVGAFLGKPPPTNEKCPESSGRSD